MNVRHPTWDDVTAVLELMQAADRAALGDTDWIETDLREEWSKLDLERDVWILELDEVIAGYASVERRGGGRFIADGYTHPDHEGRGIGSELLRLTEARALERAEPIAVRPAWRRQGLGEALMLASFREFWRRGERRVGLSVDVRGPTGAARLYERAGMRVFYRIPVYEKELRPAAT